MLILRDQPGVRTLGFISLEAASGHHIARPKEVRGSKPPYTGQLGPQSRLKNMVRSGKKRSSLELEMETDKKTGPDCTV